MQCLVQPTLRCAYTDDDTTNMSNDTNWSNDWVLRVSYSFSLVVDVVCRTRCLTDAVAVRRVVALSSLGVEAPLRLAAANRVAVPVLVAVVAATTATVGGG
ncbi:hypothetical protein DQ04_03721080 [Trypanosoma grayi]|uniref:hypothetical protein n=1 Tax=Trypanosoma grayi TaxID=71804 RepID=UPI0004F42D5B|nr:hypothetical protein DQ04_03721080 [Trypanosoma grayi]KEG10435.1 hypothetical protein DQ04_03721080 [Trypanosoma grayi]